MCMFGIIICGGCLKKRIIDLSDDVTACPYCGTKAVTKTSRILFKDNDQSAVRSALDEMTGFVSPKKKMDESIDPLSSLAYKVEHASDIGEKMMLISEGLTRIKGTFTIDDVEELVPKKGEQYVKAMLDSCMIYEVGYGRYKA